MNERLTTHSLAELLANQTGMDNKRAEDFINALVSFFMQSMERNKYVKIFGLGTFKIVLARERASVHIQTGERFVIPAHFKMTYAPDKDFKEMINRPFALFEPVQAFEIEVKEQQADSTSDEYLLQEEQQVGLTYEEDELQEELTYDEDQELKSEEDVLQEELTCNEDEALKSEEDILQEALTYEEDEELAFEEESMQEELSYEEKALIEELALENDLMNQAEAFQEEMPYQVVPAFDTFTNTEQSVDSKYISVKKKYFWLLFLILPVCVILGSIVAVYFFLNNNSEKFSKVKQPQELSQTTDKSPLSFEEVSDEANLSSNNEIIETDNSANLASHIVVKNIETVSAKQAEKQTVDWLVPTSANLRPEARRVDQPSRVIENRTMSNNTRQSTAGNTSRATTATNTPISKAKSVKMPAGSTLRQVALENYGDKVFWVYIYEHNKNIIKDPDKVPVGTVIQLPAASVYGIDPKNSYSVQRARQKQTQMTNSNN